MTHASRNFLNRLFSPESIAVVGASTSPNKLGTVPIRLLQQHGYRGAIYPVNPRAERIEGLRCYPSLSAIPQSCDLVIFSVPAALVCEALEGARAEQIKSAVIFSSGFAEVGEGGKQAQQRLLEIARARNIHLVGPNCLGFINTRTQAYATFTPAAFKGAVKAGNIGMVTQSGAFGAYAYTLMAERGLGLSYWITTGNEADVDVADCIQFLAHDPHTDVIMAYIEGCQHGDNLKQALVEVERQGKRIVITKVGRTRAGAQAAASHTAALAGDDAIYRTLFKQAGVLRAHSVEEFFNLGHALALWREAPSYPAIGILSLSGGVGALMADDAEVLGLSLPPLDESVASALKKKVPFAGVNNPVDITGQAVTSPELLTDTATDMLASGKYGGLVVFLAAAGGSEAFWEPIQVFAKALHKRFPTIPIAICALLSPERRKILETWNCMVFSDPSAAVQTLGTVLKRQPARLPDIDNALPVRKVTLSCRGPLHEIDALTILQEIGVPVPVHSLARSEDEAVAAIQTLDQPVVMKVVSTDILHKSDVGGVQLGVEGEHDIRQAFRSIMSACATAVPDAMIDGVLLAPMARPGVECIIGVHRDPVFGPVVMFGLGGIFVEVFEDISFRLAPFDEEEALGMIHETKAGQILQGARGGQVADIEALVKTLVMLGQFAHVHRDEIVSIDINPLRVFAKGQGVLALDALVITAGE